MKNLKKILLCFVILGNLFASNEKEIPSNTLFNAGVINEFESIGLPIGAILKTIPEIRSIILTDNPDIIGAYKPSTNTLYLGQEFINAETKNIKHASLWGPSLVDTFYHEIWHAYKDLVLKDDKNDFYLRFKYNTKNIYKEEEIYLNEAYGLYIGHIVNNYVRTYRAIEKLPKEAKEKFCNNENVIKSFNESLFKSEIYGYKIKLNGEMITSVNNLKFNDRAMILMNFFDNEFSLSFENSFENICI